MKTVYYPSPDNMTIEQFAEHYDLTMEIRERSILEQSQGFERIYGRFARTEINEGNCLETVIGQGMSADSAIADYARKIAGKVMVVDAMLPERKELNVPVGVVLGR